MKQNLKGFVTGIIVSALVFSMVGTSFAKSGTIQKELEYNNISVTLDGKKLDLRDAKGNSVEPFMFDGTNYLPVRALAEALGLNVTWDGTTQTVKLSSTTDGEKTTNTGSYADGKNHDIEITGATLSYSYSIPTLYLDFKNNTNQNIKRFDIYVLCYDAYGNQIGSLYKGYNVETLPANESGSQYWDLVLYNGVQEVRFGVYKYVTEDGAIVEIPEDSIKWWKKAY